LRSADFFCDLLQHTPKTTLCEFTFLPLMQPIVSQCCENLFRYLYPMTSQQACKEIFMQQPIIFLSLQTSDTTARPAGKTRP